MSELSPGPANKPAKDEAEQAGSGQGFSGVKIYDRPERSTFSPVVIIVTIAILLVLLLGLIMMYRH